MTGRVALVSSCYWTSPTVCMNLQRWPWYRFSYLVVARFEREQRCDSRASVLAVGSERRSCRVRADSVICGGRSWGSEGARLGAARCGAGDTAHGGAGGACERSRGGPGTARRVAVLIVARASRRPRTWMVPGAELTCSRCRYREPRAGPAGGDLFADFAPHLTRLFSPNLIFVDNAIYDHLYINFH